mmetsp:Transcript_14025/g.18277  ORF Transcript_14025/g.18277 Transcript_14025/m.18277 type:complete len:311 (-) Transcript_14025:175-1107(-)|eukprot:CAMPEP_0198148322 /NCGR_PEP_ID=MMETSP1443-20131203/40876_1 /TAXON_ID=186043 /ORGANISM="Entomoneis sp., Strain CCMP2396" /LENGTH=310 /DNA_ID=CAMNT_0043812977 /DNA_START=76 /DNA_END=1008 /DNA_ORIENTATION=-
MTPLKIFLLLLALRKVEPFTANTNVPNTQLIRLSDPGLIGKAMIDHRRNSQQFSTSFGKVEEKESTNALSPLESWWMVYVEARYSEAYSIRCPFFKRRASDLLDAMDQTMRFLVIRHKSLPLVGPPAGWRCQNDKLEKSMHLSSEELMAAIRQDWKVDTNKGYYITGRLSLTCYRDDCLFDGPDPDMPVRGLRKYLSAASQLFDPAKSRAELLSLEIIPDSTSRNGKNVFSSDRILAKWRICGVLRLPWKPTLPELTGSTIYHRDENGLIYKHVETWDVSMVEAFVRTFWPDMAPQIWASSRQDIGQRIQ